MRKPTAIFLLIVFAASYNMYWLLNTVNHARMQARVNDMLQSPAYEDQLEKLQFSTEEYNRLEFEDDGHELELNGRMYDIVKVKDTPQGKIIYCISDEKETGLKDWARKNNPVKNERIKNALSKIYIPGPSVDIPAKIVTPAEYITYPVLNTISARIEVIKPPPKFSCS